MNFYDLNCFVTLARLENYNKAAEFLFITQPALSKKIKNIEQELDLVLIDRIGTKIRLNENGRIFYDFCIDILNKYKDLKIDLENNNKDIITELSVIQSCNMPYLDVFLSEFMEEFKNIKFSLFQHRQDSLNLYEWDFKIYASKNKNEHNATFLFSEDLTLAISKNNMLVNKEIITLKDIENMNLFLMPEGTWINLEIIDIFEKLKFRPKVRFFNDNSFTIMNLVSMNKGVSFIPDKSFEFADNEGVVLKKVENINIKRYIYIKNNLEIKESNTARLFKEKIALYYKNLYDREKE